MLAVKRRVLAAAGAEVPVAEAAGEARGSILRQSSLDKVELPLRTGDWAGVAADLSTPAWADALRAAGFDPHKPTVWVAEGLLMYLRPEAVDSVLKQAAGQCWLSMT